MGKLRESLGMAVPWRICFSSEAVTVVGTVVGSPLLEPSPSGSSQAPQETGGSTAFLPGVGDW